MLGQNDNATAVAFGPRRKRQAIQGGRRVELENRVEVGVAKDADVGHCSSSKQALVCNITRFAASGA